MNPYADASPTLELFMPEQPGVRPAILICPGGGYGTLAPHEGEAIGEWVAGLGLIGAVLKYRHAPEFTHPVPITDAARAMRLLRYHAARYRIDPERIAVMGFSAGGHLAASLSTGATGAVTLNDELDHQSCRPDASILVYPVIALDDEKLCHVGSLRNLTGMQADHPAELLHALSPYRHVRSDTPPTFLIHAADDVPVPVGNSLLYATALQAAGVPFALHVMPKGNHGFGLASGRPHLQEWPSLLRSWLQQLGWL
jgi:acetyl esterase/lipase